MKFNLQSLLVIVALVAAALSAYFTWQGEIREKLNKVALSTKENAEKITEFEPRVLPTNVIEKIEGDLLSVPRGAVIPFNSTDCPEPDTEWREYKQAYGHFIRGIDKSGDKLDPDAPRTPGSFQSDELKAHRHRTIVMIADPNIDGVDSTTTRSGEHHNEHRQTGLFGGSETRPKNVALLFCEKL